MVRPSMPPSALIFAEGGDRHLRQIRGRRRQLATLVGHGCCRPLIWNSSVEPWILILRSQRRPPGAARFLMQSSAMKSRTDSPLASNLLCPLRALSPVPKSSTRRWGSSLAELFEPSRASATRNQLRGLLVSSRALIGVRLSTPTAPICS